MRYMLLMIPKGYEEAKPGASPTAAAVEKMMAYNRSLLDAGVLIALDGLQPPAMGARLTFSGHGPTIQDGPFTEAGETLGGYWMIEAASKDEAVSWASRCPVSGEAVIEVRQVQELADFPEDVRAAAAGFPDMQMLAQVR